MVRPLSVTMVTPRIHAGKSIGNLLVGSHFDLNLRVKVATILLPPSTMLHHLQIVPLAKSKLKHYKSCPASRCQIPEPLSLEADKWHRKETF